MLSTVGSTLDAIIETLRGTPFSTLTFHHHGR